MSTRGRDPSRSPDAGAVAGILGIVIPSAGVAVLPIWEFPGTKASDAELVRFVTEHQNALQFVMITNAVGVTLWMVFGAALWAWLRRRGGDPTLVAIFGAGLVGFTTLLLAGFTAFDVLVYRAPDVDTPRLLYDLTFGLLAMSGLPTAISLGAFAAVVYRDHVLPARTAHLAVVAAAAHVLLLLAFIVPTSFFSLEGQSITVIPGLLWAWIIITSVTMLREPS